MYLKQDWEVGEAGGTPFSANRMDHLEEGVEQADITNPGSDARALLNQLLSSGSTAPNGGASILLSEEPGAVDYDIDPTGDGSAAWVSALNRSHVEGRAINIDIRMRCSATIVNQSVFIDPSSKKRLVQTKGKKVLDLYHDLGAGLSASAIDHVWVRSNDNGDPWQVYSTFTVPRADMLTSEPNQGDKYFLTSSLIIPGDFIGDGENTFAAEWVPVAGVGLKVTHNSAGGAVQGIKVIGSTTGATGFVAANVSDLTGQAMITLNGVTGAFQNGETITSNGVEKATITAEPFIIGAKILDHNHAGFTPKLRKGRTDLRTELTGLYIETDGNTDDNQVLAAEREPAIQLTTTVGAKISGAFLSSWKSGLQLRACEGTQFVIDINKLPGYALDSQGAWGYGVVCLGACDNTTGMFPHAQNARHSATSLIRPTVSVPSTADYIACQGVSHRTVITSSNFFNHTDAPIDQHGGSMYWVVKDCYIGFTGSFGRLQARGAGIQNRGFGFTCENTTIEGTIDGIRDISAYWPTSTATTNIYRNITMRGIKRYGWNMIAGSKGDDTNGKTKTIIDNPRVTFDERHGNPNPNAIINMDVGNVEIIDPACSGLDNGNPGYFGVMGSATLRPDSVLIRGGLTDFSDGTGSERGWQIQSTAPIPYFGIYDHKFRGGGSSIVRVGAVGQVLFADDNGSIDQSNTIPFATVFTPDGATAPGSYSITSMKETGSVINAQDTWPGATIAAGAFAAPFTMTAGGAKVGDYADAVPANTLPDGVEVIAARVSADDTVVVRIQNTTAAEVVVPSKTIRVRVQK